jgi:hypothetical protein
MRLSIMGQNKSGISACRCISPMSIPIVNISVILRMLIRYETSAPTELGCLLSTILASFKNNNSSTVEMSKLSMPAQGHGTSKVVVRRGLVGSVAVRRDMTPAVAKLV